MVFLHLFLRYVKAVELLRLMVFRRSL